MIGNELIYVVDDDEDVGKVLGFCLRRAGYRVCVFSGSLEALNAFQACTPKPSLLIADFDMPGMNGMELMQRLKQLSPSLKTISHSGVLTQERLESFAIQPDAAVQKPLPLEDMLMLVRKLLSGGTA